MQGVGVLHATPTPHPISSSNTSGNDTILFKSSSMTLAFVLLHSDVKNKPASEQYAPVIADLGGLVKYRKFFVRSIENSAHALFVNKTLTTLLIYDLSSLPALI